MTREWSFDVSCHDAFIAAHPTTIELKHDMYIYKTKQNVYFKFIETHNLDELTQLLGNVEYDPDGHVFVISPSEYTKLEEYVQQKGLKAMMRNFEQVCTIKRKI